MAIINAAFAERFGAEWIDAWNAHDLDRVLTHYSGDFEMSSPVIVDMLGEASGTLRGKAAVGGYWAKALARFPDLRFELLTILTGVRSITLYYRSVGGRLTAEVFHFDDAGKVCRAFAHYAAGSLPGSA